METNTEVRVVIALSPALYGRLEHVAALLNTTVPKLVSDTTNGVVVQELERLAGNVQGIFRAQVARADAHANGNGTVTPERRAYVHRRNRHPNVTAGIARDWRRRIRDGESMTTIAKETGYHPHTVRNWVTK